MAGIDVNKITSTLARLPDQALQQYAAMHKNDPYIMSLAMSESNRRKEMRAAAQAPQGMQEQPKVVDAALAQMAPQEAGIATLPAPNMQMMADGGIAGYEGYDEGDESYGQEPVMMMAEGGVARYQSGGVMGDMPGYVPGARPFMPQAGAPEEVPLFRRMFREARATGSNYQVEQAKARIAAGLGTSADEAILAAAQPEQSKAPSAQDMAMFDAASNLYMTEREAGRAGKAAPAAPPTGGGKAAPGASRPSATAAAAPEQSAAARYAALQKEMGMGPEAGADMAWQRSQLAERMRAQSKGELEDFEKDVAARGEAFKGREERLAKREAELGKQKDENAGLALLEAGMAIMSTPGKLAEAVGKGAQAGLKTYGAGLEKLRAAQEKMDDARDQIEEFRRNEANMTAKERRQFKSQINRTETDIEKLSLDAAKEMYGYKREDAKAVFSASTQERLTDKEIQGRKEAAAISAGPGYERNKLLAASQGNEAKVRAEYGKLQAKVMGELSKDQDYLLAPEAKKQLMQTTALRQALMNNPFLAPYAAGIGFSATPTGGKVYDLTED